MDKEIGQSGERVLKERKRLMDKEIGQGESGYLKREKEINV